MPRIARLIVKEEPSFGTPFGPGPYVKWGCILIRVIKRKTPPLAEK